MNPPHTCPPWADVCSVDSADGHIYHASNPVDVPAAVEHSDRLQVGLSRLDDPGEPGITTVEVIVGAEVTPCEALAFCRLVLKHARRATDGPARCRRAADEGRADAGHPALLRGSDGAR